MQIIIYDETTKKIESYLKWPNGKPYPNAIPTGQKMATVDELQSGDVYYNEATGVTEPAPDAEKATAIRNQLADIYNAECTVKIITGYTYKGQYVNASEKRQQEFDSLYVKKDALTYPYSLKVSSDTDREPVEINIADEAEMTIFLDGLFWHYKSCLDECRSKKRANAAKSLAELQKIT